MPRFDGPTLVLVTPAKAGIQGRRSDLGTWIPAFAGMTVGGSGKISHFGRVRKGLTNMALDKAAVAHIAALARIRVDEGELEPLAAELSHILEWVEQLNEVDTEGVEAMTSVAAMRLPMREDIVTDGDCREPILANAPQTARGFFVVPKVVE
jgi:aspartyl-tRNA(Asn)/glutamyl-tRNA(Gln) amidotransferase subunit C